MTQAGGRRPRWRRIAAVAAVLLLLLALQMTVLEISRARCFSLVGEAICRVETEAPVVALTFDDGPTPSGVALARQVLRENDARGTFFLIGSEVAGREDLVRQLVADGHEIGNHSYSHPRMIFRWPGSYDEEIGRADTVLRRAGAPALTLFRPPYGKKLIGLPNALARHNYRMIMWDVEDPPGAADPRAYAAEIVRQARPGSIILMHVMYAPNAVAREALPLVVRGLRARGFRLVTVSELLATEG
ncbi:MAG TPA: polysaccharide deacetylase family protein [Allosphingosinicella sp.]|nr:polysaccharide deacetylase family protein [Allosphingosinicella sp.]